MCSSLESTNSDTDVGLRHQLGPLVLVALGVGLASIGRAQQFLLTVYDSGDQFLALIDTEGVVLGRTDTLPGPLGPARFYRGGRWVSHQGSGITVFGPYGERIHDVRSIPGWNSMDVFEDGRTVIREPWSSSSVYVLDALGAVTSQFPFPPCAAGPDYGLRTGPDGDIWLAMECGGYLRRTDTSGVVLAELLVPGGVSTTFDDSCDDFVPDPDGSVWLRQGSDPAFALHYAWSGTLLGTFQIPAGSSGLAVADDGTVWVRDDLNHLLVQYDPSGALLGATAYDTSWSVWSFDIVSPKPAGQSYCGPANRNSTGVAGTLECLKLAGSPHLVLVASHLPPGEAGFHLVARATDFVPGVGGGNGNLCLGDPIGRYDQVPWVVGADGRVRSTIDLGALPMPFGEVAAVPGETWFFQAWHRDHHPGPTSNLTDGLALTIE